jgi:pimeloyl-ACP methyl ester carboxylesterase
VRGLLASHVLHYTEWGDPQSKQVVVCAHGYSGNARDFDYLARRLAERARVACIDFPGRGDSQWLDSPLEYNLPQFATGARALIERLGAKQVDWVGTSMGGLVGMQLAAQGASPIRRLVLNDVGAYLPMGALQEIARHLEAPESFASLEAVEKHLRRTRRDWGPIDESQWPALARHHARALRPGSSQWRLHFDPRLARLVRPLPFSPGLSFWDAWYRVRCPVLLMRGERSEVLPADVAETMLDVQPGTELVVVPDCGHVPSLMNEEDAATVVGFLQDGGISTRERRSDPRPPLPARAA